MMSAKFNHDRYWLPWQQNLGNVAQNWLELGLHKRLTHHIVLTLSYKVVCFFYIYIIK